MDKEFNKLSIYNESLFKDYLVKLFEDSKNIGEVKPFRINSTIPTSRNKYSKILKFRLFITLLKYSNEIL